jgi:predicted HTH transcriptional regulator
MDSITEDHLESLKLNAVRENRVVEYKVSIGNSDEEKKDFLAAISSLANTSGGDLLVGIAAKDGIPVDVRGLSGSVDAEKLRLENLVRDGLQPRLSSLHIRDVRLANGNSVLVLRVRRSGTRIIACASGVMTSSTHETAPVSTLWTCRSSVTRLLEQRRSLSVPAIFVWNGFSAVKAGETPVLLKQGSKTVFHVIPHSAFGEGSLANLDALAGVATSANGAKSLLPRPWRDQFALQHRRACSERTSDS